MKMFCPKCGAKNEDTAIFCEKCGFNLAEGKPITPSPAATPTPNPGVPVRPQAPTPVRPQATGSQAGAPPVRPPMPPKPPKEPKPKGYILGIVLPIVEGVLALIFICVGFSILSKGFSAERAAEKYFVNLANGNYEEAYEMLDISPADKAYLTEESFEVYAQTLDFSEVTKYTVGISTGSDLLDELFGKAMDAASSLLGNNIVISYRERGAEYDDYFEVSLSEAGKRALFFTDYKVNYRSIVAENYQIETVPGATITLDGQVLDSSLKKLDEYGYDVYTVPKMFQGTHTITASLDGCEDLTVHEYAYSDCYAYLTDMQLSQEGMDKLQDLAVENMQLILDAASKNADFSTISHIFSQKSESDLEWIKDDYDYICEWMSKDRYDIITNLELSNITTSMVSDYLAVTIHFDYKVDFYNERWDHSIEYDDYSSNDDRTFYFEYEDGEFKQTNIGIYTLYFY